jgi:hypothetical protein
VTSLFLLPSAALAGTVAMAVTGRPARPGGLARVVRMFVLTVAAGITGFVVIGLFTASGQAHLFAEGAFLTGIGIAFLSLVVRLVARLPLGELIGLAALMTLIDGIFGR